MRRSDALVGVGVGADAAAGAVIERIDRGDLLVGELEVEDVEVLCHPLGLGGLGSAIFGWRYRSDDLGPDRSHCWLVESMVMMFRSWQASSCQRSTAR